MSVHQTKDGRWFVRYRKGRNPDDLDRTIEYFGLGREGKNAAEKRNKALTDRRKTSKKTASTPTFAELTTAYLSAKQGSMSTSGMGNLVIKLKGIILPALGNKDAGRLRPSELDKYVAVRLKSVKTTTVHRELSDIRAILNWSVKRKLIVENPMSGFEMPTRDDTIILPPTGSEYQEILKNAAPHLKRAMQITYHTGLRPGREELLSLTWDAVDLINKTITVISAQKGGLPMRVVPLNGTVLSEIEKWYIEDKGKGFLIHYRKRQIGSLKTAWQTAKKKAKVTRPMRMYAIRHMAISDMLGAGADLRSVSEIVGHASPDMTLRVYTHSNTQQKRDAVSRLK